MTIIVITFALGKYLEAQAKVKTGDMVTGIARQKRLVIRDPEGKPASYRAGGKKVEINNSRELCMVTASS